MEKNRTNEPHSSEPGTRAWGAQLPAVLRLPHFQTALGMLFATISVVATHQFSGGESRSGRQRWLQEIKNAERVICDVIL